MSRRKFDVSECVTKDDCNRVHAKIDLALFGADGRGGMVKDVTDIRNFMKDQNQLNKNDKAEQEEENAETKTKKHDYRSFLFAIVGGVIVAAVNYLFNLLK